MANDNENNLSDVEGNPAMSSQGAVDATQLKTDTTTTESGEEVKTSIPHGDYADVRADDPPVVAAQKVFDAQEKIREETDTTAPTPEEIRAKQMAALDPGQNSDVGIKKA